MDKSQEGYFISMNEVMSTLWLGWGRSTKEIAGTEYCSELSQEIFNILSTEYFVFYFHFLDRMLSTNQKISHATQDIMMKEAKRIAIYTFEGEDEKMIQTKDKPFKLNSGIGGALEFFSKYSYAVNFSEICEIRCAEYAKYKNCIYWEGIEESRENNAHKIFSNRIIDLVKCNSEDLFREKLNEVTEKYLRFYTDRFREIGILEKE